MKKFFILFLGLFLAIVAVKLASSQVLAYGGGNYLPLSQRIIERFNLDPNEVKLFFDEMRQERIQQIKERAETRLNEAVSSGKITQEQKKIILEKMNELNQKMENLKNLSFEERCIKNQELQKEMREWAQKNGINFGFLRRFQMGFGRGLGPRGLCPNL